MNLSYLARRRLRRVGIAVAIVLLLLILAWICWVVWLERYVVYSRDGAELNFQLKEITGPGQIANAPYSDETIPIFYNEGENALDAGTELGQLQGYYIDADTLAHDISTARDTVATLGAGTAVMVEVKNIYGGFHYSSDLADAITASSVDPVAVDELISEITTRNLYPIAILPGLRDRNYGLNHVSAGLELKNGGGVLWVDEKNCYWLDPTDSNALSWLAQIANELHDKGFKEVVFSDFYIPTSEKIKFTEDKVEAIYQAANTLVASCATNTFAVSFVAQDTSFKLPEGRSRIYMENVGAKNISTIASQMNIEDPEVRLVFIANTNDTRFDEYSVLRPITIAGNG